MTCLISVQFWAAICNDQTPSQGCHSDWKGKLLWEQSLLATNSPSLFSSRFTNSSLPILLSKVSLWVLKNTPSCCLRTRCSPLKGEGHHSTCGGLWQGLDHICKCEEINLQAPWAVTASSPETVYWGCFHTRAEMAGLPCSRCSRGSQMGLNFKTVIKNTWELQSTLFVRKSYSSPWT